jgi:hypothetical protein
MTEKANKKHTLNGKKLVIKLNTNNIRMAQNTTQLTSGCRLTIHPAEMDPKECPTTDTFSMRCLFRMRRTVSVNWAGEKEEEK